MIFRSRQFIKGKARVNLIGEVGKYKHHGLSNTVSDGRPQLGHGQ